MNFKIEKKFSKLQQIQSVIQGKLGKVNYQRCKLVRKHIFKYN